MKSVTAVLVMSAIVVSLLAGMQPVEVAKADFVPNFPPPNKDPPILTMNAPQNFTTLDVGSVLLNFTVTKPSSWNQSGVSLASLGTIEGVNVTLNGKDAFQDNGFSMYGLYGNWSQGYLVKVDELHGGANILKVNVNAVTPYLSVYWDESGKEFVEQLDYPMTITDTIIVNCSYAGACGDLFLEIVGVIAAVAIVIVSLLAYLGKRRGLL